MKKLSNERYTGERALFFGEDLEIENCLFEDGESPLKESKHIRLTGCTFAWKYPLWYSRDIAVNACTWRETARSGVWYTDEITVEDSFIDAPKTFRRASGVTLRRVRMPHAAETMWHCRDVVLEDVEAAGDYFGMDCDNVRAERFRLDGNYCFDGARNVRVKDAYLNSKDSFWNTTDVVVEDSVIIGEYLGWNSTNLTLINCTVESLQGMCYINNLRLVNCTLRNTTLAFEYCSVDADVVGTVDSVLNPTSGVIRAGRIGELIIEPNRVDPSRTTVIIKE